MAKARVFVAILALIFSGSVFAYDVEKAKFFEQMYAPFADQQTGRALSRMPPADFADLIKSGVEVQVLDVRTPAEIRIMPLGGALTFQMNEVFLPENLAQLATDKPIIVMCQGGLRNTMIAVALRQIGFDNARSVTDGMQGLIDYLTIPAAHAPVQQK